MGASFRPSMIGLDVHENDAAMLFGAFTLIGNASSAASDGKPSIAMQPAFISLHGGASPRDCFLPSMQSGTPAIASAILDVIATF